ncbi:hypothetical protein [Psychroserpens sp. SPM9]|uniref:hypothetical protein n=1 Tax=Psychroserpens sp. SPM9 TaxID=2975598 RepID=UPI0021A456F4|nr:hypothetical protein [Psychroserpens sp. SPM9]MDG5493214.1 hypothetical protein [Psychroserpens sp. SPM9]
MNKIIYVLILGILPISTFSQERSEKAILDSIINEADLLYKYEKITWNSTDLAYSNERIKENIGTYIVYLSNDTLFAVFADKEYKNQIAKYSFTKKNLKVPYSEDYEVKPISEKVSKLVEVKNAILKNLNSNAEKYSFNFQKGFNPNLVLIPEISGYKLYIIIGTPNSNVIPFGNDYLFKTDERGNVISWKKFHKTLIATQTKGPNNEVVVSAIHSHLKMTPYISATDICTFRLYGFDLFGMEEFMVTSTALNKVFKYNAKQNSITATEL